MAVLELPTDRRLHIARYAKGALVAAGAIGRVPTPLEDVTAALNLHQAEDLFALGEDVPPGLMARLAKLGGKVLGGLAIGERKVYIDMQQALPKRRFTHGHELGHAALPWQPDCYYCDNATTLDPDTRDELEAEASAFSAALLFNLDQFRDQAHSFQLGLAAPLMLADTFQTSRHASIRRYVEDAPRPCALLILGRYLNRPAGRNSVVVRQGIESETFRQKYGRAAECLPNYLPLDENELAKDAFAAVCGTGEPITSGQIMVSTSKRGTTRMDYEIFYNQYQVFALLMPAKLRIFGQRLNVEWTA